MSVPKILTLFIPEILSHPAIAGRAKTLSVPPVGEYRASNRQITNLIDPFVALGGHPQQQEFFDCCAQRQLLRN